METYKIIKDFPNYKIYEDGKVVRMEHTSAKGRRLKEKEIRPYTAKNKYLMISIHDKQGKQKMFYLHRLVFEAFFGKIPQGHEIDHIDGDRANCSTQNLRCCTHKQNCSNPQSLEKYKRANARNKGKYDYDRLQNARTKAKEDALNATYMMLLVNEGTDVSVMRLMEEGHCGFYRAKRVLENFLQNGNIAPA